MSTASLRPVTILPQICTVWRAKLRKHLQLWKCFTISPLQSDCLTCIKLQWRQRVGSYSAHAKQGGCRARQQWDFDYLYLGHIEAAVRKYQWWSARCFTATSENEKFQHYRTEQSMSEPTKVFQAGCLNLAQMKASVELCINKLSNTDAKTEI